MVTAGFFLSASAAEVWNSCLLYKNNDDMKIGKEPAVGHSAAEPGG